MKRGFNFLLLALAVIGSVNAQSVIGVEGILKQHVYTLASKEMRGRAKNTQYADMALDYIQSNLASAGLKSEIYEYTITESDVIAAEVTDETEDVNDEIILEEMKHKILYSVINATNKANDYIIIHAQYTGNGVDTIQGHEIFNYGANHDAAAVAILMETAKNINAAKSLLKHNYIVVFYDSWDSSFLADSVFTAKFNTIAHFQVTRLGLHTKDDNGDYTEDANIIYTINSREFKNFSSIVQPILLPDTGVNSLIEETYVKNSACMISNDNYISAYNDVADSLDYTMMTKITNQLSAVFIAIGVEKKLEIEKQTFEDEIASNYNFDKQTKRKSFFGLNLMYGDNWHYYKDGYMTGKNSYALACGLFYKWQYSKYSALKLEANYERAYAKRHDGKFRSDVVSIPLTYLVTTNYYGNTGFEIGIGAYYDYMFAGQLQHQDIDFDKFNCHEIGYTYEVNLRFKHFIIGYQYKHSFTDKMIDYDKSKIIENTSSIKLSWQF